MIPSTGLVSILKIKLLFFLVWILFKDNFLERKRETERQRDRETERQRERQRDRETE